MTKTCDITTFLAGKTPRSKAASSTRCAPGLPLPAAAGGGGSTASHMMAFNALSSAANGSTIVSASLWLLLPRRLSETAAAGIAVLVLRSSRDTKLAPRNSRPLPVGLLLSVCSSARVTSSCGGR